MPNQKEKEILDRMAQLGFNKYEAKTYITLLEDSEISAYEISKQSGVPQSKIYETVKGLVEEGIIIAQGSNPVHYSPLPLKEFISRYRKKLEENLSTLEDELKDFGQQPDIDYMWHFQGKQICLDKAKEIIQEAEESLLLEVWEEELTGIKEELISAARNNVSITTVFYGESIDLPGEVFYHRLEGLSKSKSEEGRWLTVIADKKNCFFGSFGSEETEAIWTQNKAFMLMAKSFISHDIYISEINNEFGDKLDNKFGPNLRDLRRNF
ncbi:MAG: TrmB family transcriptional regulator [Halarsenatibacteraceae bacterium]